MRRLLLFSCGLVLLSLVAFNTARPQAEPDFPPYGLPRSDKVLHVEVVLPDGKSARVMVRDGTLLAIESKVLGDTVLGLLPALDNGRVGWLPVQILGDGAVDQLPPSRRPELVHESTPVVLNTKWGPFQLTLLNLSVRSFPLEAPRTPKLTDEQRALYGRYAASGKGRCCVFNQGWSLCAGAVEFLEDSCETEAIARLASRVAE